MLVQSGRWATQPTLISPVPALPVLSKPVSSIPTSHRAIRLANKRRALSIRFGARRRVRYENDEDDDEVEEYGYNQEIAMLEMYTQSARGEALLVRATVDDQDLEVLIFKGFSSSLSHGTSADPSKSVLPARAVIKTIDRIKGPFDPSNIQYIERDLHWDAFKTRLSS